MSKLLYIAAIKNGILKIYSIGGESCYFYVKHEYTYTDNQKINWKGIYQNVLPVSNSVIADLEVILSCSSVISDFSTTTISITDVQKNLFTLV